MAFAATHHPALAAAQAELEAAQARAAQAGVLPDPMVGLRARSGPGEVSLEVAQELPLGGKRRLRVAAAAAEVLAAQELFHAQQLRVRAEVVAAYAELHFLARARQLTAANVELLGQLERLALARYRVAQAPFADVVRAQVELGRGEDELRALGETYAAAASRLNAALGRAVGTPLSPPHELPPFPADLNEEEVEATLVRANPELAALAHAAAGARWARQLARQNRVPDLTAGLEVMGGGEMGGLRVGLLAGVNLPLWAGRRRAEVAEATARLTAVTAQEEERRLELFAQARLALYGFRDARRREELYRARLLPAIEQTLNAMQAAYRTGEASFADLIETARLHLEFAMAGERARADGVQRLAELERLTGRRWWQ